MVTNARLYVDPPSRTELPYGLFSVVQPRNGDVHWQNGVTWQSLCPGGSTFYDSCITSAPTASGTATAKAQTTARTTRGATPFTVFAEVDCSTVGFADEAEALGRQALLDIEEKLVETVFWNGTVSNAPNAQLPHLASTGVITDPTDSRIVLQPTTVVVTGNAVNIVDGLGSLESALAGCYAGQGVIHVPRTLAPTLFALGLVYAEAGKLYTQSGNLVALSTGSPNTGPDGSATSPSEAWMFGTGPLFMYRSEVRTFPVRESIVRSVNTLKMIGERNYVLGFDCCLYAVRVFKKSIIATQTAG